MRAIITICIIDLFLTLYLIGTGSFEEGNPLMRYYLRYGIAGFCLMKAFFVAAPLFVAQVYRRTNPQLVAASLKFVTAGYLSLYGGGWLIKNIAPMFF
jgi:hypothetical protein